MNHKHLSFEERIIIEELLNKGISIHQIAKKLHRQDSTVVREVKRHRYISDEPRGTWCEGLQRNPSQACTKRFKNEECVYQIETGKHCYRSYCRDCDEMCNPEHCDDFRPYLCNNLKKSPFVCNGCKKHACTEHGSPKYKYHARRAQVCSEDTLRESRRGIALSQEEMQSLDNLVSPLLLNGQSIRSVYITHKDELPCSESSLYNYIDQCYLTARNIDMPRKVRFKTRYSHGPRSAVERECLLKRTYIDFQKYMEANPDATVWEMDTVVGTIGSRKCILTLLCRKTTFMIAILLPEHTQEAVIRALNWICDKLSIEVFQQLFSVILTDRGTEFSNPYALECDENGEIKTHVFYCDPYCSWQKGMVERNHEFIRMIIPKGSNFDRLTHKDIHLMANHINNYPRKSLNNVSPYALSKLLLGNQFLVPLEYYEIRPDDVILKRKLLKKPRK